MDRDDSANHVDGRDAVWVVPAVLAHYAEGPRAEARSRLATPSLTRETDVVGAADSSLTLAALGYV